MVKRRKSSLPRVWISAVGRAEMASIKQALEALPRVVAQIGAEIIALRDMVDQMVAALPRRRTRTSPATSPATSPVQVEEQSAAEDLAGVAPF